MLDLQDIHKDVLVFLPKTVATATPSKQRTTNLDAMMSAALNKIREGEGN